MHIQRNQDLDYQYCHPFWELVFPPLHTSIVVEVVYFLNAGLHALRLLVYEHKRDAALI